MGFKTNMAECAAYTLIIQFRVGETEGLGLQIQLGHWSVI